MNSTDTNDKKYLESLKTMSAPVPFKDLPKVKFDFQAILKFAEEKGVNPNDLTMEEREQFVKPLEG